MTQTQTLLIASAVASAIALVAPAPLAAKPKRVAVVVGANAASPGRKALRFAHADAAAVADVLTLTGVEKKDIETLRDPKPSEVLAALDRALGKLESQGEDSVLFFYYSGHADAEALYPAGEKLALAKLRTRLESPAATVRIGIIDACRGGGWTGTKGLSETEAFAVNIPLNLASEGSVLISSSSGLEDAHESANLRGSFFTHHFSAGLRGAADDNQDGTVTLAEAFSYARELTVRDTSIHTENPQHPSFQMNLRGVADIALVSVLPKESSLTVSQDVGPLQLVHLGTGVVVLELPKGKRTATLALPSGRYLVRRRDTDRTFARQITVTAGAPGQIAESELRPHEGGPVVAKGLPEKVTPSFLRRSDWRLRVGMGISHAPFLGIDTPQDDSFGNARNGAATLGLTYGITDRWQLEVLRPAIAYRGGQKGRFEWIPKAGLLAWGIGGGSEGSYVIGQFGAGLDTRLWLRPETSLNTELTTSSMLGYASSDRFCDGETIGCPQGERGQRYAPGTLRVEGSVGLSHNFGDLLTVNVAVGLAANPIYDGGLARSSSDRELEYSLGSIQSRGFSRLPLFELHLSESFSLFGDVQIRRNLRTEETSETYLGGVIWRW